jgi:cell wall-associated NlpC family hydrolase
LVIISAVFLLVSPGLAKKSSASSSKKKGSEQQKSPAPKEEAKPESDLVVYVAGEGETLESIAEMYNTTAEMIVDFNQFPDGTRAEPGLVITIPVGKKSWTDPRREEGEGKDFAREALLYQGVPYRRAGTSWRGLDCSGLVYRVLRDQGRSVPRTAASLYSIGIPVDKEELRPGDLVFFKTSGGRSISHVGIYVGEGKFVHASSSQRRVVVTELDRGYYARQYVGARRLRPKAEEPAAKIGVRG